MSNSTYQAGSVAVLGGVATFLAVGPAAYFNVPLFAVLIGWAAFHQLGGGPEGLKKAIAHFVLGALLAALALALSSHPPFGDSIGAAAWTAIAVAVTLGALFLAARQPLAGSFPVALLAFATLLGAAGHDDRIVALTPDNPLIVATLALIVGALFAWAADALAEALRKYLPLPGGKAPAASS